MLTFENLRIAIIKKGTTFRALVKKDGRSYQYLHKECSDGNQEILKKMFSLLE